MTLLITSAAYGKPSYTTSINKYKLSQIQDMLVSYLEINHPELSLGTEEFYQYALDQLIEGHDAILSAMSEYRLISIYLAEYINSYNDYIYASTLIKTPSIDNNRVAMAIIEDNTSLSYSAINNSVSFDISKDFLNTTVEGIIKRNQLSENHSQVTPYSDDGEGSDYSYNPTTAVNYAQRYAKSRNYSFPFYSNGDCTNFVSQCLNAGNMPMIGSGTSSGITESTTKWYCNKLSSGFSVTTSWIRVQDFYDTLKYKATSVASYRYKASINTYANVGDVVILRHKDTGTVYHSIIISLKNSSGVSYCGHTNPKCDEPLNNIDDTVNSFHLLKFY